MYVHRRVAVQPTLPLGSERTDHTATRPSAYRFGTLDAIWQCETHCHSGPSVQSRVGGTATRPRAYRSHCHSGLNVPPSYVHRRVAVWMTLPCTFTAEWQCNLHCHSGPSVPITLPLGPQRTASVRSTPFGSVRRTATRARACSPAWITLPLGPQRTASVRSTPFGSVRRTATRVRACSTVWVALPNGPERSTLVRSPASGSVNAPPDAPTRLSQRPQAGSRQAIDVFGVPPPHKALDPRVRPSQAHLSL